MTRETELRKGTESTGYLDWETNPLSWDDLALLTGLSFGVLAFDYAGMFLFQTGRISEGVRLIGRGMTGVMLAVLFLTTAYLLIRRWKNSRAGGA